MSPFAEIGEEQKIRINLSDTALDVILHDLETLKQKRNSRDDSENPNHNKKSTRPITKGTILNHLFAAYYPTAAASISRVLHEKTVEYREILHLGIEESSPTLELLKKDLKKKLESKAGSYEGGETLTFRLNIKNYNYLTKNPLCNENLYYTSISRYVKAVLEEYARLPLIKREPFLYKEHFDTITDAIQNAHLLHISLQGAKEYDVYPYAIRTDLSETAHYLVCCSINPETLKKEPHSFRISGLKSVDSTRLSGKLTKEDKKHIEQRIQERGVQFLSYADDIPIKIRLTPRGKQIYQNSPHLRPPYDTELSKGDIYVFHCTESQARFYFVKFGKEAEVLEPKELREKFKAIYSKAYNVYSKK